MTVGDAQVHPEVQSKNTFNHISNTYQIYLNNIQSSVRPVEISYMNEIHYRILSGKSMEIVWSRPYKLCNGS